MQNQLNGTPLPMTKCMRCHRPLKVPESILRGFGPICWGKVSSDVREQAEAGPRTIEDATKAAMAIAEFRDWVMAHLTHDKCYCGTPYENCGVESYDYGNSKAGYVLEGFKFRQWVFLHCPKCGHDTAIWKIVPWWTNATDPHLS